MLKPLAILSSDWHIRADTPRGRTDNYLEAQFDKIEHIIDLSDKLNIPILIAGDLGDKPKWPDWLIKRFMDILLKNSTYRDIFVIPGQHDLLNHKLKLWGKHGIGVLDEARAIDVICDEIVGLGNGIGIHGFPYGIGINGYVENQHDYSIAMSHQMVIDTPLWLGQEATKGIELLKKFPEYNIILTGDNHKTFTASYKGRHLVNPGSLMRMTIAQMDHKPCVFIWYDDNSIEQHFLPISEDVLTEEHIKPKEEYDARMDAYINQLNTSYEISLSFENNAEIHFKENKTRKPVQDKVRLFMEKK